MSATLSIRPLHFFRTAHGTYYNHESHRDIPVAYGHQRYFTHDLSWSITKKNCGWSIAPQRIRDEYLYFHQSAKEFGVYDHTFKRLGDAIYALEQIITDGKG